LHSFLPGQLFPHLSSFELLDPQKKLARLDCLPLGLHDGEQRLRLGWSDVAS
jgi:hypothetical protein